jgi:hypothetical protein
MLLRKHIILKALQARIAQGFDSKGVVGEKSIRRTPVSRGDELGLLIRADISRRGDRAWAP